MRSIVILACLVLVIFVNESQSAPRGFESFIEGLVMKNVDSQEYVDAPEVDYTAVNFENVELGATEIGMDPSELYARVLECVEKCRASITKNTYRDKCLAKTCDIYKKKK